MVLFLGIVEIVKGFSLVTCIRGKIPYSGLSEEPGNSNASALLYLEHSEVL